LVLYNRRMVYFNNRRASDIILYDELVKGTFVIPGQPIDISSLQLFTWIIDFFLIQDANNYLRLRHFFRNFCAIYGKLLVVRTPIGA